MDVDFITFGKIELPDESVNLLIGARYARHYSGKEVRLGGADDPVGYHTGFVRCIVEPISDREKLVNIQSIDVHDEDSLSEFEKLETMMLRMYKHDFVAHPEKEFPQDKRHNSQNDNHSIKQNTETLKYDGKSRKYICNLPCPYGKEKTYEVFSQLNFLGNARMRDKKLKEKLSENPTLLEGSFKHVQNLIDNGYARVIPDHTAQPGSPTCHLPLLVVTRSDKPGKSVCQDAAAKVKEVSLNKYLLNEPKILNNLMVALLRFRRKKVVLSADIKDSFYQAGLDERNCPATRFLWRTVKTMKEMIIQGLSHLLVLAFSPPVSHIILRKFAIDTLEQGAMMKEKLTEALSLANFQLTKWKSNFPSLSDDIEPPTQQAESANDDAAKKFDRQRRANTPAGSLDSAGGKFAEDNEHDDDAPSSPWSLETTGKVSEWDKKICRLAIIRKTLLTLRLRPVEESVNVINAYNLIPKKENLNQERPPVASLSEPSAPKEAPEPPLRVFVPNQEPMAGTHGGNLTPDGENLTPDEGIETSTKATPAQIENFENKNFKNLSTKNSCPAAGPTVDHAAGAEAPNKVTVTLTNWKISDELLIRAIQAKFFNKEIKTLLKLEVFEPNWIHELKEKASKNLSLSPFIDDKSIMRVEGRFGKSKTIPYVHEYPKMPNSDAEKTQSLVRCYHTKDFH